MNSLLTGDMMLQQITPCGHVFSFHAIMGHLMTHGGDVARTATPCPVCTALIAARELRLVRAMTVHQHRVGILIIIINLNYHKNIRL